VVEIKPHAFSDLYDMSSGISTTASQAGHGSPFLSFSTVFNHHFVPEVLPDFMDTSESEKRTYSIRKGDVFLTRTSETVDELGMSCVALNDYPQATYSGFLKRLRPKKVGATDPKFMAFYLRSPLFRRTMTNNAVMVLRASLNEQIFSYLNLLLPDLDTQVSIGEFLYLLTAKIDLNNRINAELEALAKTIYDYWFVQFDFPDAHGRPYKSSGGAMVRNETLKREIPAAWDVGSLWSIATYTNGLPMQKFRPEGDTYLPVIKIREMSDGFTADTERASPSIPKKCIVEDGDVLFSWSATLAIQIWTRGRGALNQHIFKVTSKTYPKSFFYFELFNYLDHFKMMAEKRKTTMGHITLDHLRQSVVVTPPLPLIEKLDVLLRPIFEQCVGLSKQNLELIQLRDWLLPLLMNGQVRVA
jgi:type I restriction enzyme S subunit